MKFIMLLTMAFTSLAVCTANGDTNITDKTSGKDKGELRKRSIYRLTGGRVRKPGAQQGSIGFIVEKNCRFDGARIRDLIDFLKVSRKIDIQYLETEKLPKVRLGDELKKLKFNAGIFVRWDDSSELPMIYAPEMRFAVVNVASLKQGARDENVFRERILKESARAFAYVCGAGGSMSGEGIMNAVSVEDLDAQTVQLPFDLINRLVPYLKSIGVTPWCETTYRNACQQGWAPAPTNDIQKAIWDKVHQLPKKPMKIEFDPKKGR